MSDEKKCDGKCRLDVLRDEHPCPYQADVHNDPDSSCHCCEACTHECADDI